MRNALALSMIVLLAAAGGCQNNQQPAERVASQPQQPAVQPVAHDMTPEQLGELGAQIRDEPARANELLTKHGLNEKTFEEKIRRITEDPDASKRYADAYRKAKA